MDELSPFMVMERVPWWRNPAWVLPAVAAAFGACLLTAVLWPIAAIIRRRHRIPLGLNQRDAYGHLLSRVAAAGVTAVTIGWATLIGLGLSHLEYLGPGLDPVLFVLHALSVVTYLGGAAVLVWAAYAAWSARRRWYARLWNTALGISGVVMLWTACAFHLMSFRSTY
jgi:hypothetical protein